MSIRRLIAAVLVFTLVVTAGTWAERAPEEKSFASHVVVGTVEGIYVRKENGTFHYIVEIAVEKVEKGDGLKPGATLYVSCYQHDPDWLKGKVLTEKEQKEYAFRGSSYDSLPKEGQRVRAYAKQWGSKYAALFPSWHEPIKGK
jgi:hypothetical protein